MKQIPEYNFIFDNVFSLLDSNDYSGALQALEGHLVSLNHHSEIEYFCLSCGFLNIKLHQYSQAINYFTKSIEARKMHEFSTIWSEDISYSGRSDSRYKFNDFRGAIEDKRIAKKLRKLEIQKYAKTNFKTFDFKAILLNSLNEFQFNQKYRFLISIFKKEELKYDLIDDYKKFITHEKREEIIQELESISDIKYIKKDFKGSIRALRRSEKYY